MSGESFDFDGWVVLEADGRPFMSGGLPALLQSEKSAQAVETATRRADQTEPRRVAPARVRVEVLEP